MVLVERKPPEFVPAQNEIDIRGFPPEDRSDPPNLAETLGAAFRIDNPVVSAFVKEDLGDDTVDLDYDYNEGVIGTKYEDHLNQFAALTFNKHQQKALMARIDRQIEDRQILQSAGLMGTGASMVAAVASPDILLPGGAVIKAGKVGSVLKSGLSVSTAAGFGAGIAEYSLHQSQDVRTVKESTVAVGSSVVLGGLLGSGFGHMFSRGESEAAKSGIERALKEDGEANFNAFQTAVAKPAPAGSAAAPEPVSGDYAVAGQAASNAANLVRPMIPAIRDANRSSAVYQSVMARLNEIGFGLERNIRGEGDTAAETAAKYWERGVWGDGAAKEQELFKSARKNGFTAQYEEFRKAVGQAFSNGDVSDVPEVQAAAQYWRARLFNPLSQEGIRVGALTQEQIDGILKVNRGYRPRMYIVPKIVSEKADFRERVLPWIERSARAAQREGSGPDFVSEADFDGYVRDVFNEFYDKVTTQDGTDIPDFITSNLRGPLKERTLNIPDSALGDFIESDSLALTKFYARRAGTDIELARQFGRADMKDQVAQIREDYDRLWEAESDPAKKAALQKERIAVIGDLEARRDIIRGVYKADLQASNVGRVLRAANLFNYVRALGGVLLSSLTDSVRPAMVHGLRAFMDDGLGPLITNLEGYKINADQLRIMGVAAERISAGRIATMAEIADPYAMYSPFERTLNNMAVGFSRMTGLLHWTDFWKTFSGTIAQNRILRNIAQEYDALTPRELEYQGYLGIEADMASRIRDQFARHGEDMDGLFVSNFHNWDDPDAKRVFVSAMIKDSNTTVVTATASDIPHFMQQPIGRAALQFKSFAIASNQRVLMRGLQGDLDRFLGGIVGMATIGMFVYWLKTLESGREISNNPGTWIAEGLDRSGIFSIAFEVNNVFEKLGGPGVYTAASGAYRQFDPSADARQPASRYAVRNQFGALLGPSFGLGSDLTSLTAVGVNAMTGDLELHSSDISAARRVTPFASLPYWRWFIDGMAVPKAKEAIQ